EEAWRVLVPGGRCVIMLYHRWSIVVVRLYLKYGLRAGRPLRTFSQIVASHVESPGTKAYSLTQLRRMFRRFSEVEVAPVVTVYDTYRLPRWGGRWLPAAVGWFAVATGRKEG